MEMKVTHRLHQELELSYQQQALFTYVYASQSPPLESPRPYFHPLRSLAGNEVSLFRPYDHPWHIGLSFSIANLSGINFWGGTTYTSEAGYVQLDNNGYIQHRDWQTITCQDRLLCIEQLQWITPAREIWIEETRQISVSEIDPQAGYWCLDLAFHLHNSAQKTLRFGSPTTEGRPGAGYGGLFWRGPRSFLAGNILAADGRSGPELMGQSSPWLAFSGWHDGNKQQSTLLFLDQPGNPRYPNKWFVRHNPYACASYSFMFDEYSLLQPGETLDLAYRLLIGNGEWSRKRIETYVATHSPVAR